MFARYHFIKKYLRLFSATPPIREYKFIKNGADHQTHIQMKAFSFTTVLVSFTEVKMWHQEKSL